MKFITIILLSSLLCLQCGQKSKFSKGIFKGVEAYNPSLSSLVFFLKPWDCYRCFYMFCPFLNEAVMQYHKKRINLLIVFAQTREKEVYALWQQYGCSHKNTKMPPWIISQKKYTVFFKQFCSGKHLSISHYAIFDSKGALIVENDLRHLPTPETFKTLLSKK